MSSPIITRFAPSPTGYLHVGGARTALFNWLLARHGGGKYLLRIEDTDLARSTEQAGEQLLTDLRWLGLNWDNAELVYQSRRLSIYNRIIDDLMNRGVAYEAFETSEELANQRLQAERAKRSFIYRRPKLSADQIAEYRSAGRTPVIRFAIPVKDYDFTDAVLGPHQGVAASQVQDFVIRKSDGMPTYHFAVVVDDAEMGITHILRGQEHLLNTVNHIALQEALDYARPVFAHLPVILNPDTGEKLSKRDRDRKIRQRARDWMRNNKKTADDVAQVSGLSASRIADWIGNDKLQLDLAEQPAVMAVVKLTEADLPEIMVHDFRKNGYLPEVLNNFLALLGWSPGGDIERMSMDELVARFSLDRIGQSNSKFNREKLLAFNTEACASASPERLLLAFKDYLHANPQSPLNQASDEQLGRLLAMKAGFRALREVEEKSRFLFLGDDQIEYDSAAVEKFLLKNDRQGLAVLLETQALLAAAPDFSAATLESAINAYLAERSLKLNAIAQPLRIALTGATISPPIFQSLEFLGREATLARIDRLLARLAETS